MTDGQTDGREAKLRGLGKVRDASENKAKLQRKRKHGEKNKTKADITLQHQPQRHDVQTTGNVEGVHREIVSISREALRQH